MSGIERVRAADGEERISLCSVRTCGRRFGIDTRAIREVLRQERVSAVPLAPAFVVGVMAYRGEVVTAVSLRVLLGEARSEAAGCVLVLDGDEEEQRFALVVDAVGGVVTVERGTMAANPTTLDEASRALFVGAFQTEEGLLVQLDPERLRPARLAAAGCFGTVTMRRSRAGGLG